MALGSIGLGVQAILGPLRLLPSALRPPRDAGGVVPYRSPTGPRGNRSGLVLAGVRTGGPRLRQLGSQTVADRLRVGGHARAAARASMMEWRRCTTRMQRTLPGSSERTWSSGGAASRWCVQLSPGWRGVDDGAMGVTRVVRGRDLAASTATQMALQGLLALSAPIYRHHLLSTGNPRAQVGQAAWRGRPS